MGHTKTSVVSTACGRACAIIGLRGFWRDLVSAPAVDAVGQSHDVFALLQTDQLAVTGTLEVVVAMVLERGAGLEAADAVHGTGGLGSGGRGNVVLDGCRWRVIGGGGRQ